MATPHTSGPNTRPGHQPAGKKRSMGFTLSGRPAFKWRSSEKLLSVTTFMMIRRLFNVALPRVSLQHSPTAVAILLIAICSGVIVHAQGKDTLNTGGAGRSTVGAIAVDALVVVPAGVLWLMNHELGHFTLASISGATNPRMGIWKKKPEGGFKLGWAEWDGQLSDAGNAATALGGVTFSRGLAEGVDLLTSNVRMPSWSQPFLAMTFILGRFDFARYVFFDALHNVTGSPGSDIDMFVTAVAGDEGFGRVLTYGVLLTVATLDLVWDWDRIAVYGGILGGRDYPYPEEAQHARLSITPCVGGRVAGVHVSLSW